MECWPKAKPPSPIRPNGSSAANVWQDQEHGITYGLATLADGSQTLFIHRPQRQHRGKSKAGPPATSASTGRGRPALPPSPPRPPAPPIEGDLKPHDHDPQAAGIQEEPRQPRQRHRRQRSRRQPPRHPLRDSTGNDRLLGHGGNDTLHAGAAETTSSKAAPGRTPSPAAPATTFWAGGTDSDVLIGGAGDDHRFAQDQTNDLAAAILAAENPARQRRAGATGSPATTAPTRGRRCRQRRPAGRIRRRPPDRRRRQRQPLRRRAGAMPASTGR